MKILKPCPFCGSKKITIIQDQDDFPKGIACKCGINIYFFHPKKGWNLGCDSIEKIIKAWNKRIKN